MRTPPQDIEILLPVWGERYIRDFLEFCLPSLLAPGNLPGLSRLGRCTFVLMAPAREAEIIRQSPLWALLKACCAIRVQTIDDLVSQSSATVLTLAYALAIRQAGARALDTCFVFLVADYVVSDGSLCAAVELILGGASGVVAGNFQIASDVAFRALDKKKDEAGVLAIPSRALVQLSLDAMHSTTLADIVNQSELLNPDGNRLFWRVDDRCMVGRFFLMHMVAIHPETTDFVIAAPSDYCFIPELCPSGHVVAIKDSDDYFVIECLRPDRGAPTTAMERREPRSVAGALETWATAQHRDNARHALIFHADAASPDLAEIVAASEMFVREVRANDNGAPLPFRHHPLWARMLDYHVNTARMEQSPARLAAITGDRSLESAMRAASRPRSLLLGRVPYFRPWHPRWPDVRMLKTVLAAADGEVAIVSDPSARIRAWLDMAAGQAGGKITYIRPEDRVDPTNVGAGRLDVRFDWVFLIVDEVPDQPVALLQMAASLVKPGRVVVLVIGTIFSEAELVPVSTPSELIEASGCLTSERIFGVTTGTARAAVQGAMMRWAKWSTGPLSPRSICWLAAAGGLAALSMFFNIGAARRRSSPELRFTSLFFTFRKPDAQPQRVVSPVKLEIALFDD
jgi:hypothetical protein